MFIRHSTPSNSKWDKKKNKKTPTQDYYWTNKKNLNIHLFAGINKWIYSVSYLERHLNINKQTPSVRQKHYQWRTHFFLLQESPIYTLYSYTLAAERYLSQPAMLKSQSVQKMLRPRTCTVMSLWLNVYSLLWTKKCITKTQCGCVQYRLPKGLYLARSSRNVQNHCRLYTRYQHLKRSHKQNIHLNAWSIHPPLHVRYILYICQQYTSNQIISFHHLLLCVTR